MTTEQTHQLIAAFCAALGIVSLQARTIWQLVRERNYCRELLVREQQSHMQKQSETLRNSIERQNELLKILATAFASAEPVTLDDLLSHAERDWSLKSSKMPSDPEG
jgi:hypothetical protein